MSNSFKLHPKHFSKRGRPPIHEMPQFLHHPSQTKVLQPSQSKVLCTKKEMTFDQRLKTLGLQFFRFILLLLSKS